jgi:hypothetical protein
MKPVLVILATLAAAPGLAVPAAAANHETVACRQALSECEKRKTQTEVPSIQDQIRGRRERGIDRPRLDRPSIAEPSFGAPGFMVLDPRAVIGD